MSKDKIFTKEVVFVAGVTNYENMINPDLPEFAFAGKSNVGKSSLINAIINNGNMARTSNTPGRTQEINFFSIDGQLMLVDMPGYGYAKVTKTLKEEWAGLITDYFKGRPNLKKAFILIDSRRGIKEHDNELMNLLDECGVSYFIVMTKQDKIKEHEIEILNKETIEKIKKHPACFPTPIWTSAEKRIGIKEVQQTILEF
jgi:GTP-binding protein